jgi:hypothetical protein
MYKILVMMIFLLCGQAQASYIDLASTTGSTQDPVQTDPFAAEIENNLSKFQGKTLYNSALTTLMQINTTLDDLSNVSINLLSKDNETPNLTPLKVVDSRYLKTENAVVLAVILPSGEIRYLYGDLQTYHVLTKLPLLERMDIWAETSIPSKFSKREKSAIRTRTIYRGMSADGLYWSWGTPKKSNDWGLGGQQLIYGSSTYVYLRNDLIIDWQRLDY